MEVEKTSGVLASCPLAAEGNSKEQGSLFPEKAESGRVEYTRDERMENETEGEKWQNVRGVNPHSVVALVVVVFVVLQRWLFVLASFNCDRKH